MFTRKLRVVDVAAMLGVVILASAASLGLADPRREAPSGGGVNPAVMPLNSKFQGKTYAEWSAEHWKWLLSIPAATNPANDFTGANGAIGQSGHVWFLCGSFCPEPPATCGSFTVTRNLAVPTGTALFFPIIDAECSTVEGNGTTDAELRACAKYFMDFSAGMSCHIDGVPVRNLESYRVQSPLFEFGPLPDGNIFGAPAGTSSASVSDGVFLMVKPLSAGSHTIHFTGGFPEFGFGMDITYNLTVSGPDVPTEANRTSWGKLKVLYR